MKAKLINVYYNKGKLKWWLFSEIKGQIKVFSYITGLPIKDYFFCNEKQKNLIENLFSDVDIMRVSEDYVFADHYAKDWDVYKVELSPYRKNKIRTELELDHNELVFEADVSYIDLVLKDLNIYSAVEIRDGMVHPTEDFHIDIPSCFFDIETDDRPSILKKSEYETFAKPDVSRLLSFSIWDTQKQKVSFFTDRDEERLLRRFKEEIEKFIRIEAWNGDEFDFTMIRGRMKVYDIPFDIKRFYTLDSMRIHEMLNPKERKFLAIDSIAKKYLEMRKIRHTQSFYEMYKEYHEGKNTLLEEYNNRDVEIMAGLEDKFGFGGVVMETAFSIGILPHKYNYARKPSQVLIRRYSMDHFGRRFVWKSKSEIPEKIKFTGAKVFEPHVGLYNNVIGVDLSSLYNNIIQTFNISPEQLRIYAHEQPVFHIREDDEGNRLLEPIPIYPHDYHRFDQDGIMRKTLQEVEKTRNHFKKLRNEQTDTAMYKLYDMKQTGQKAVLLSVYGGLGARGSTRGKEGSGMVSGKKEFYDWYCADDVTRYARQIIDMAEEVVNEMGYKVVYGDTDSIYISVGERRYEIDEIKAITIEILSKINQRYSEWLDGLKVPKKWQKIEMEGQGYYSPFMVLDKKKNYFAREIWNAENDLMHDPDHVEIYGKGLKPFKPSATDFHKWFLIDLYTKILQWEDPKKIDQWIELHKSKLMEGEYEDQVIFEKKLTKYIYHDNPAETYNNLTADVELAKKLIDEGKLQEKGAIYFKYGFIGERPSGKSGIVCIGEWAESKSSGREYFWSHHIEKDVNEVMNVAYGEWHTVVDRLEGTEDRVLVRDWKSVLYQTTLNDWF